MNAETLGPFRMHDTWLTDSGGHGWLCLDRLAQLFVIPRGAGRFWVEVQDHQWADKSGHCVLVRPTMYGPFWYWRLDPTDSFTGLTYYASRWLDSRCHRKAQKLCIRLLYEE